MKKTTIAVVVLAVLLIAGAVFVSAEFLQEDAEEPEQDQEQSVCGVQTCNQQCGGNCGVPKCGCGR